MVKLPQTTTKGLSFQDALMPMIDVIFVLLAFLLLLVNAPLFSLQVDLPQTHQASVANLDSTALIITMKQDDDAWYVEDKSYSLEQLSAELQAQKNLHADKLAVIVHSDSQVDMARMVTLFALMQQLDIRIAQLAVDRA